MVDVREETAQVHMKAGCNRRNKREHMRTQTIFEQFEMGFYCFTFLSGCRCTCRGMVADWRWGSQDETISPPIEAEVPPPAVYPSRVRDRLEHVKLGRSRNCSSDHAVGFSV